MRCCTESQTIGETFQIYFLLHQFVFPQLRNNKIKMCDVPETKLEMNATESNNSNISASGTEQLAYSVLSLYVDNMKKSSSSLQELVQNQNIVIETLEQENVRVTEAMKNYPLDEMFSRIKIYHSKAQQLKKDMIAIHERTNKLKKRAMKLQQQKQKEALQKELQKDRDLERDKMLAPKIVTK